MTGTSKELDATIVLDAISPALAAGAVPGAVVGVWRDGDVSLDATGTTEVDGETPLTVDAVVRVSSNTKPIVAALTLALAADGVLALDDPVERYVPELGDRRVVRRLDAPIGDTVPASRQPTVEDLLTMRFGLGFVFEADCPVTHQAAAAGLGMGPPDPSVPLTPEEWIERLARLPLLDEPGAVWRYDLAYAVLGVLVSRAARAPLGQLLDTRLFAPLAMGDTGFVAPPDRLPACYVTGPSGLEPFDSADASRWARPPSFPDARNGLVSTAADLLRFAGALLDDGGPVLDARDVDRMTSDHLTPEQRQMPSAQAFLDGSGWGYGVQVAHPDHGQGVQQRRYGWGGGLGTLWYSWPEARTAAVLLTQVLSPPVELVDAFTTAVETRLQGTASVTPPGLAEGSA